MINQTITTDASIGHAKDKVKTLVIDALCIALTYLFTACVNFCFLSGTGGLVHLGNVPLLMAAIVFGRKTGALAGGIGMGLFDLLSGWAIWSPFTLVIVGLMGYVVGAITQKHKGVSWTLLAMVIACLIKVGGYYIAEGIIYGNWIAPVLSIPANIMQVAVAAALVLPISGRLKKASSYMIAK